MTARDEVLTSLRNRKRDVALPAPWRSRRQFEDLAARFVAALEAAKGEAMQVDTFDAALDTLDGVLEAVSAERVVVNRELPLDEVDWRARWPAIDWHVVEEANGESLRAYCARADVGISSGRAALAETGSVLLDSGPGRSRLATLLPPVHVVLLPTARLTADVFTWTADRDLNRRLPANLTFVSGPSKSGDIEQTLTVGVHGPGRFITILYSES